MPNTTSFSTSFLCILIILADQTHSCHAVSRLDNVVAVKCGIAVVDEQAEQQKAQDTALRRSLRLSSM